VSNSGDPSAANAGLCAVEENASKEAAAAGKEFEKGGNADGGEKEDDGKGAYDRAAGESGGGEAGGGGRNVGERDVVVVVGDDGE